MAMAPNLWDLLSESKRIIKANPRHYLTLSLIFLLPLSISSLLFQRFFKPFQPQTNINPTLLFFYLLYYLSSLLFSFGAVSSITYSVFHGFFGRPVKLHDAIKSISTSFFPLLATNIVSFVFFFFIFFLFWLLFALVIFLGVERVDVTTLTNLVVLFVALLTLVLLPVVMYLQVNWSLVPVIVVVESCWGLEPLRRSASLVKGMKWVALSSLLFFGLLQGILVWSCTSLSTTSYGWLLILGISPSVAMLMLCNIAVITVLYIHCKGNHGQLELAEQEFQFGNEKDNDSLPLIP